MVELSLLIGGLALLPAIALAVLGARAAASRHRPLVERIDALLPQTQCGQCDYAGCLPYARAIAAGEAEINQCPPGGERTIRNLARLLGREPTPLNTAHGEPKPVPTVVRIDEARCIGCTLCIQACPVDAIIGAAKQMHTVIREECTGCDLCIAPCPVDCIHVETVPERTRGGDLARRAWLPSGPTARAARRRTERSRQRYRARQGRLAREREERQRRRERKKAALTATAEGAATANLDHAGKQAVIQAAVARARAKRARLRAAGGSSDEGVRE